MTNDQLHALFLFEKCTDEQLTWIANNTSEIEFAANEQVFAQDAPTNALWVLLDGEIQIYRTIEGRTVVMETSQMPGNWVGWLPMFDQTPMTLGARVTQPSRLLRIPREGVQYMLSEGFPIAHHLLAGMFYGVQNFEALSRQQEKMAALGKLSAGLAHELNNPAAATSRAASQLGAVVATMTTRTLALCQANLSQEQMAAADTLRLAIIEKASHGAPIDALARSDQEEALASWLDEQSVEDAWQIAPQLVDAGVDAAWLKRETSSIPATALSVTLHWIDSGITANSLVATIGDSSNRISDLVQAVKSYSFMDQADMQEIDVHEGIETTLKILHHKLQRGVTVERYYDQSLPKICAYGGELNQVWTNIIDNAVDAMDGHGAITITTRREATCLLVEIADTGPGIPAELQTRIFEPFFTTKPQGEGSGLGLDIAYRIVTQRHGGDIKLKSQPGNTRFQILLPVQAE